VRLEWTRQGAREMDRGEGRRRRARRL